MKHLAAGIFALAFTFTILGTADAQIGRRFPSEKKIVKDPVTGTMLTFLTSTRRAIRRSIKHIISGHLTANG